MKHRILISVVIIAFLKNAAFSECVNPFSKIGDNLYYIEYNQKLNWFAAAARCIQLGGQLATIENEREMNLLSSHLMTQGYTKGWIWTSGIGKPGAFLAFSDPPRIMPYAKWAQNQPDDAGSKEDCVHIFRQNNEFFMNDRNCRDEGNFICETKPPFNSANLDIRSGFIN